jgi:hypothetical protein
MQLSRGDLVALHDVRFSMEGAHVVEKAAGNPAPPLGLGAISGGAGAEADERGLSWKTLSRGTRTDC